MAEPKDPKDTATPDESETIKKNIEERRKALNETIKEYQALNKKAEALQEIAQSEDELAEAAEARAEAQQKYIQMQRETLKIQRMKGELDEQEYKNQLRKLRGQEKEIENSKAQQGNLEKIRIGWVGVGAQQMVATAGLGQFFQRAQNGFGLFKSAQVEALDMLAKAFTNLADMQKETAQTGVSMNDSESWGQYVGLVRDANGELQTFTEFGVGFKELQQAANGLRESMVGFTDQSTTAQQVMSANAATMKNLGVSYDTTGKSFNFLTKSLGFAGRDAAKIHDQLAKTGLAAGISVKKMLGDFAQIGPQLAAQGPKAVEVFKDLAKQAKSLGVEVSDLLSVVGSAMDTFEGAATSAGRFNAVMGGDYLNAVELLNATESERVDIIKRQMDATGKNFATMSKYEKIAVANALGIKDVNLAQEMLGNSTEEMKKKKEQEAATDEKLNQLKREAVDIGARLASMFQVITAVARPFLIILEGLTSILTYLNDAGKGIPAIIISGILLSKGFATLSSSVGGVSGAISSMKDGLYSAFPAWTEKKRKIREIEKELEKLKDATDEASVAQRKLLETQKEAIKADKSSIGVKGFFARLVDLLPMLIMLGTWIHDVWVEPHSPPLIEVFGQILPTAIENFAGALEKIAEPALKFGGAMLMIGGGIFLAAYGMAQLVKAFAGLEPAQILGAVAALGILAAVMYVMATALITVGTTAGVAAIPMLAFGAAIMMIGIGIGIAAAGMSLLVESFVTLLNGGANVAQVFGLAAGLYYLSGAVGALGLAFAGLALIAIPAWLGAKAIASAIENIGEAYDEFPAEKSIQFKASTDSLTGILEQIKQVKNEDIQPTVDFMKEAKQYMITSALTSLSGENMIIKLLTMLLSVTQIGVQSMGKKEGDNKKEVYEIKLNEKVFGELVRKEAGVGTKAGSRLTT